MQVALIASLLAILPPPAAAPPIVTKLRAGPTVIVVEDAGLRQACVQIHIRTGSTGRTPDDAQATLAFAQAFADGGNGGPRDVSARSDVALVGGETRFLLTADGFVVSDTVPAVHIDVALRAVDKRLARRRKLAVSATPTLPIADDDVEIPLLARQLLAPGHGYAFALDTKAAPTPVELARLADLWVHGDDVVVVVIAPEPTAKTLRRAERFLRTPLPTGANLVAPLPTVSGTRVVDDVDIPTPEALVGAPAVLTVIPLPHPENSTVLDDARTIARATDFIVAELAGFVVVDRAAARVALLHMRDGHGADDDALIPVAAIASHGVDDQTLALAVARVRTKLLRRRSESVVSMALGLGRDHLLFGRVDALDATLDALPQVTSDDVKRASVSLLASGRVVVKGREVATWR